MWGRGSITPVPVIVLHKCDENQHEDQFLLVVLDERPNFLMELHLNSLELFVYDFVLFDDVLSTFLS